MLNLFSLLDSGAGIWEQSGSVTVRRWTRRTDGRTDKRTPCSVWERSDHQEQKQQVQEPVSSQSVSKLQLMKKHHHCWNDISQNKTRLQPDTKESLFFTLFTTQPMMILKIRVRFKSHCRQRGHDLNQETGSCHGTGSSWDLHQGPVIAQMETLSLSERSDMEQLLLAVFKTISWLTNVNKPLSNLTETVIYEANGNWETEFSWRNGVSIGRT